MNESFDLKKPQHLIAVFLVVFTLLAIPLTVISVLTSRDERSQAASTTTISVTPLAQSVNVNTDFSVQIRENSGTTQVTTADIQLTYDNTKLDYVSIDPATTSDFKSNVSDGVNPPFSVDEATGQLSFLRWVQLPNCDGVPPGSCPDTFVTGDKLIATLRFRTLQAAGSAAINFVSTSMILGDDGDETIASGRNNGTVTVVDLPPAVSLTAPTAGAHVRGNNVTVSATATDNIGVTRVEFYDGATIIGSPDTTSPYSVTWNTTSLTAGNHSLTARAFDANGSNPSAAVTVVVDNTPPTAVTISGLATKVKGPVIVSATATETNIDRFEFRVGTGVITTDTTSPYQYNIDTTTLPNGTNTLSVTVFDRAGASATASQNFVVDNQGPTSPSLSSPVQTETTIDLSWTAATDALSGPVTYDVYRGGVKVNASPLSTTSYQVGTLTAGTSYSFIVKALDTMGNSTDSNALNVSTKNPPKEGDINGDNSVNSPDLGILIATWGSTTDLRADLSKDGRVNSADLAKLISRWGT